MNADKNKAQETAVFVLSYRRLSAFIGGH